MRGGQVIAGLKHDPDDLEAAFGPELGPRLVAAAGGAAEAVFRLIARHDIACEARRDGWIQAAHGAGGLAAARRRADQWARRGVAVRLLDAEEMARRLGGGDYAGGWYDPRGGALQPLGYARGLARAAAGQGARLFAGSPAVRLSREDGRWRLETPAGAVAAGAVVLATNGYTDGLWPGLARSLVPLYSFQAATEPLPPALRRSILPGGEVVSDTRRLLRYFRLDAAGRLLLGGRGPFDERPGFADARELRRTMAALFPQLGAVALEYVWGGRVAMTADHLPHLHRLAPGLYAGLGYNGRGVALATVMGGCLAELARGAEAEAIALPVTGLRPIRAHRLHRPLLRALVGYYRLRDALEPRPRPA